jgi:hypothetical protein
MRMSFLRLVAACALWIGLGTSPVHAQSVTLRFQIIEADGFTETDPAIEDVQEALAGLFRFQGYRLAAEAVITAGGGGSFSQTLASRGDQVYRITANGAAFPAAGQDSGPFHIKDLVLWTDEHTPVLETSLSVPVGQTVVVGSARASSEEPTLILVVRVVGR